MEEETFDDHTKVHTHKSKYTGIHEHYRQASHMHTQAHSRQAHTHTQTLKNHTKKIKISQSHFKKVGEKGK